MSSIGGSTRVAWLDHARGLSIILIVLLHSNYALEGPPATGPVAQLIELVRPFRLPALFFLSGLFLSKVLAAPLRDFLDRRVIHYAYFYTLWASIEFAPALVSHLLKGQPLAEALQRYALLFIEPHGPLWFIYALPLFFVTARLLRRVSPWIVVPVAVALSVLPIETGWVIGDRLASRFIYFYAGYLLARPALDFGSTVQHQRGAALLGLALWVLLHTALMWQGRWHESGPTAFVLGVFGVAGLVALGALLGSVRGTGWLALIGRRSLAVFLAFPLLLIVCRKLLDVARLHVNGDLSILLMAVGAIAGALALQAAVRGTALSWLFERPRWARLERGHAGAQASTKRPGAVAAGEGH